MKERIKKYTEIITRAKALGYMDQADVCSTIMDIESADRKFNLRLDDWLEADDFNFAHDFWGIRKNINRTNGFPVTDFGFFVPRFAEVN